jgi:hypothetical protein
MDAQGVGTMFKKAAEGPPPQKGDKLVQAFDSAAGDVMSGRTNLQTATTLRGQQTDRQQREQKTQDERTRVDMGRLRTPQEEEDRNKKDPQDSRAAAEGAQGAAAPAEGRDGPRGAAAPAEGRDGPRSAAAPGVARPDLRAG